jgi:hypothetical protein
MTMYRNASISPATLITTGLVLFIAHACGLAIPVATALTLVALGATIETIARVAHTSSARFLLAANLLSYMSLYLLLIGAICDASLRSARDGITFLQGLDFGVSAMVMVLVVRACIAAIMQSGGASLR